MSFRFLILILFLSSSSHATISGEFDCTAHNASANLAASNRGTNCVENMKRNDSMYEPCKEKICFIFVEEEPLISFDKLIFNESEQALSLQRPFPCDDPHSLHPSLDGISFAIHASTSTRDHLCVWGGHSSQCFFNALVDFIEVMADEGYMFAITGALLETPQRQCHHSPSTPIIDGRMILVGHFEDTSASSKGPWYQLVKPFRFEAWAIFGAVFLLFVIVAIVIGFRFHVVRQRSCISALLILIGEFDDAKSYEKAAHRTKEAERIPEGKDDGVYGRSSYFETDYSSKQEYYESQNEKGRANKSNYASFPMKYALVMSLFRFGLVAFFAVFFLFYEVAIVNFLFLQKPVELSQQVRLLSTEQLKSYSVLRNSALENIWTAIVNPRGSKFDATDELAFPWARCDSALECLNWAQDPNSPVQLSVTYGIVGTHLLENVLRCENLAVFETQDVLYSFNAGWLYNGRVNDSIKKQVDRELIALRVNGTIRDIIIDYIGEPSCNRDGETDIGPLIILIPCSLFVLPPLLISLFVLSCWKKLRSPDMKHTSSELFTTSSQGTYV